MTQVRASHLLVKTEQEAIELREKIVSGELSFSDAAAMVSLCPSGANGGDLGFFHILATVNNAAMMVQW